MRKLAQTSTALLLGSAASTAMAAGLSSGFGDARLYWRMSFDESAQRAIESSYSFVLDYDRRFGDAPPVPAMQVNFDRRGLMNAWMNGAPFARRVSLQQAEGDAGAAGNGSTYTAVDYGLLAIGAVGIGYGISTVVDQKDTPDPARAGSPSGSPPAMSPSSGPLGPITGPLSPVTGPLSPVTGPLSPVTGPLGLFTGGNSSFEERAVTPEYQQWLDEGMGGMGDLVVISR